MLVFWWQLMSEWNLVTLIESSGSTSFTDWDTWFTLVPQKVTTISFYFENKSVLKTAWSNKIWFWPILISYDTSCSSTVLPLSTKSGKSQALGHVSDTSRALSELLHHSMNWKRVFEALHEIYVHSLGCSGLCGFQSLLTLTLLSW